MRVIKTGSWVKLRRWSEVMTCRTASRDQQGGVVAGQTTMSSVRSGARQVVSSAVRSAPRPTLAPQPPHMGFSPKRLFQTVRKKAGQGRAGHLRQLAEFVHEFWSMWFFHFHINGPLNDVPNVRPAQTFRPAKSVSGSLLRFVPPHPSRPQGRAQIVEQNRGFAHGVDTGLGARVFRQMGAIAGGKDGRIAGLQMPFTRMIAVLQIHARCFAIQS